MSKSTSHSKFLLRGVLLATLSVIALGSLSLWWLTLHPEYKQPDIAVAIRIPDTLFQVRALANGLHFQVVASTRQSGFSGQLGRAVYMGSRWPDGGYVGDHDGYFASGLGFIAAWLPHKFDGGDYIQRPFAAVVVPYWFLIAGSAAGLALMLGAARPLAGRLRQAAPQAWYAAAIVLFVFFLANLVPYRIWQPGLNLVPTTPWDWVEIIFWPWAVHDEVALRSGFPLECYRWAFVHGQRVTDFHGDNTQGLCQHRMMENLCVALVAASATMLAVESLRQRRISRDSLKKTAMT